MALRIRKNGRIFCAAQTPQQAGDTYINDALHYEMSAVHRVIVTEPAEKHRQTGEWWWRGAIPPDIEVGAFYKPPSLRAPMPEEKP